MAIADTFGCDVLADGTVECWGAGPLGQALTSWSQSSATPLSVQGLSNVVALAAGQSHVCALSSAGTVECWGDDRGGQLGDRTETPSATPVAVSGLTQVTAIAAADNLTCAVIVDGN
ncbi:MAG TPA: hypothetical protein VG713_05305, partial [Pirellulales bacterium]|nr:hypothetical protein [Pirellulales bacterium]